MANGGVLAPMELVVAQVYAHLSRVESINCDVPNFCILCFDSNHIARMSRMLEINGGRILSKVSIF